MNYFAGNCKKQINNNNVLFSDVHYACGLSSSKQPQINFTSIPPNISVHHMPPNRSINIQQFLSSNEMNNLQAVIFDRFFAEEMYSFHLYKYRPNVLRILDMQDVHFLRYHRQSIVETKMQQTTNLSSQFTLSHSCMEKVMSSIPSTSTAIQHESNKFKKHKVQSILLRELASIHRSDLTLVCSTRELNLLRNEYGIPSHKLALASFFVNHDDDSDRNNTTHCHQLQSEKGEYQSNSSAFEARNDFIALGGFKHPPNVDQAKVLKYTIWPKIRQQIPDAQLHIYGAYPSSSILQLHDERNGFLVKGYAKDLNHVLSKHKVMLAPLRFGAGIKGKIIDAWNFGCPVVTTPVGSEGMTDVTSNNDEWGGIIESENIKFAQAAIDLYRNEKLWNQCQSTGRNLIKQLFDADTNFLQLNHDLQIALQERESRRNSDYFSSILWSQQARSTEYFSKWIEQKEIN
jgi:hypothetical protein